MFAWTHGAWRSQTDLTLRHAELLLHMQEIENRIGGFERQGAIDQHAALNLTALQDMLKRREEDLDELEMALDISIRQVNNDPFVSARPAPNSTR